jgi:hypothetical protein
MSLLDALVPLASVLIGAAITYWLNVRSRRRNLVENYFDQAVATVALVISTVSYVPHYGKWHEAVSGKERIELEKEVAREATLNHMRALSSARDAVAKCVPYRPTLEPFLEEPVLYFQDHAQEIIAELRKGSSR